VRRDGERYSSRPGSRRAGEVGPAQRRFPFFFMDMLHVSNYNACNRVSSLIKKKKTEFQVQTKFVSREKEDNLDTYYNVSGQIVAQFKLVTVHI
jgi:hypothetical protein